MDNAKFHRKTVLNNIAKFYGLHILWLPPYSPDKNDIEHLWANMKKYIRKNSASFTSLQNALMSFFNLN